MPRRARVLRGGVEVEVEVDVAERARGGTIVVRTGERKSRTKGSGADEGVRPTC